MWRGLFWFGDGGWVTWQELERRGSYAAKEQMDSLVAEGTTPAGINIFSSRESAAAAVVSQVSNAVPQFLSPLNTTFNYSGGPLMFRLGRRLLRSFINLGPNQTSPTASTPPHTSQVNTSNVTPYSSSLLSNFNLLQNLTRYPKFNGMVIDMLEGQLITLLVVIAFILIFLIREWVVQQQPAINMAAANEAAPEQQGGLNAAPAAPDHAQRAAQQHDHPTDEQPLEIPDQSTEVESETPRRIWPLPQRRSQSTLYTSVGGEDESAIDSLQDKKEDAIPPADKNSPAGFENAIPEDNGEVASAELPQNAQHRPSMPSRDSIARATEIRRTLDEASEAPLQKEWPGLEIFTDLWNRAGRRPSEVIKIIDEEGRNDELRWIVNAMKKSTKNLSTDNNLPSDENDSTTAVQGNLHDFEQQSASDDNSLNTVSQHSRDDFWRTVKVDELPEENESAFKLTSSPMIDSDPKAEDDNRASPIPALRDISNQQLDGSASRPPSPSFYRIKRNSDGGVASVRRPIRVPASPSSSPAQTPRELSERNPLSPDYDDSLSPEDASHLKETTLASLGKDLQDLEKNVTGLMERPQGLRSEPHTQDASTIAEQQTGAPIEVSSIDEPSAAPDRPNELETLMNWLWGEVLQSPERNDRNIGMDDAHVVGNINEEAPFVPVAHGQPLLGNGHEREQAQPGPDPEVINAALAAGIDPNEAEAVEDAEDLEGIMELIGMQGPFVGLIQNGMFCAVIVSLTILFGIWIPYIAGKIFLVFLANPVFFLFKMPLRWASSCADFVIDLVVFCAGCSYYWIDVTVRFLCNPISLIIPPLAHISQNGVLADTAKGLAENALDRLARSFVSASGNLLELDIPTFSVIAHESLRILQRQAIGYWNAIINMLIAIFDASSTSDVGHTVLAMGTNVKNNSVLLISLVITQISGWKPMIHLSIFSTRST